MSTNSEGYIVQLYTVQLAQRRLAIKQDIPLLDITVKSGDPVFAPTWEMVLEYKSGRLSEMEYTRLYSEMMRKSWTINRSRWLEVCQMEQVAISCYCTNGIFCHRHLLRGFFERVCRGQGIPFEYKGELSKDAVVS